MLPEGDCGIRNPEFGSVQEEHNLVALDTGRLYCMYRTQIGYPICSYSDDKGCTWSMPCIATYANGKKIKHPQACPRIWKCKNGKYLFWFHNNSIPKAKGLTKVRGRNPAWICGGIEKQGTIQWSQPEILLYDEDISTRMSYPDLIEQNGRYWITETQKTIARVHEIDPTLLEGLWNQGKVNKVVKDGLILTLDTEKKLLDPVRTPKFSKLTSGQGFSIDFWIRFGDLMDNQIILDSRDEAAKGILIQTDGDTIAIEVSDGMTIGKWNSDPGLLSPNVWHHVGIIVDAGPKIILFVVDGILCDGGDVRRYGWGRFSPYINDINGSNILKIKSNPHIKITGLRLYDRHLRVTEIINNYNLGRNN
jgi:hypothetical protein